jgi:Flp pilus assembly protein TadB
MLYSKTGIIDPEVLEDTHSWWARSLQMTSEAFMFTIAYLIVTFDLGITKYVRPPHDFYVREMTKEKRKTVIVSASVLIVLTYAVYVYYAKLDIIATFFLANILFLIVIIFTYRRDDE